MRWSGMDRVVMSEKTLTYPVRVVILETGETLRYESMLEFIGSLSYHSYVGGKRLTGMVQAIKNNGVYTTNNIYITRIVGGDSG